MSKHWYTNNLIQILAETCPEGFWPGRLPVSKETREKHSKNNAWYSMTEEQKLARAKKISNTKQNKTPEEKLEYANHISINRKGKGLGIEPWNKGKHGLQVAWNKGLHTPGRPRTAESLEKARQTCLEKYGTEWACQRQEARLKGQNSTINVQFEEKLKATGIEYSREFPIKNYSYDFKIDNFLVELDPYATHNSTWGIRNNPPKAADYHKNKSELAKTSGYFCIHIFDWDDQDKIIKLLQRTTKSVYARQCKVMEITKEIADNFLNMYHLQGTAKAAINIGLFFNDALVSVMTFGSPRYNKHYEYELIRYCANINVTGGAEKLFSYFINTYVPKSVLSYCDLSKFTGNTYLKLGFKLLRKSKPAKHWYNNKLQKHITDNLLRSQGFDHIFGTDYGKGTSNAELMLEHGFVEIFDCGQATYIWESK